MSIYICFSGGLGNQMFQYAFLYGLTEGKKIPVNGIMCHGAIEDARDFSLDCFDLSIPINVLDETESDWHYKILKLRRRILRKLCLLFYKDELEVVNKLKKYRIFYLPNPYHFSPYPKQMPMYIEGFFQNEKYFEKYSEDIKKEFTVKHKPSGKNVELINNLKVCESVCVHVRRGDYVSTIWADELAICDEKYYLQAIEEIKKCVHSPCFYVFSNSHDDIEWIKNNWDLGDVNYVDFDNSDYEDLRLMYNCKHFIISNSTYSWWAQYLSTNPNKVVVAPSIWNRLLPSSAGIYMQDWHIIKV